MELEKLNNQYSTEKSKYQKLSADKIKLKRLELVHFDAESDYNKLVQENNRAKIAGATEPHDKATLEAAKKKVEIAEKDLKGLRENIKQALEKVNSRFAELEQDPEMKAHLDTILAKRMERSIKKEEAKRDSYKEIKEMFEKHPNAKNLIKGIAKKNKEIAVLNDKIKKLQDKKTKTPAEKAELITYKADLKAAKKDLEARKKKIETEFLQKNYPDLSEETKSLLFDLNTMNIDKAIKGTERNIQNRKNVYREVTGRNLETEQRRHAPQTGNRTRTQLPVPVRLPWYKRLWHWIKTGERITQPDSSREQNRPIQQEDNQSNFRNSYKYEIVQDYVKQKEAELLKENSERKKQQQRQNEGR